MPHPMKIFVRSCGLAALAAATLVLAMPGAYAEEDMWPILKKQAFGDRPIKEDGMVVLEAPQKVEDAALVPLTVRVPP